MLTNEDVKNFIDLNKRILGKDISRSEALEEGVRLVRLMKIIYRPISEKNYQIIQKHREETNKQNELWFNRIKAELRD